MTDAYDETESGESAEHERQVRVDLTARAMAAALVAAKDYVPEPGRVAMAAYRGADALEVAREHYLAARKAR